MAKVLLAACLLTITVDQGLNPRGERIWLKISIFERYYSLNVGEVRHTRHINWSNMIIFVLNNLKIFYLKECTFKTPWGTESYLALNLPAKYKFYTKYELSYEDRSRSVSGLKMSLRACRTRMQCQ